MAAEHCYQRVLSKITCCLKFGFHFQQAAVVHLPSLGDEEDPVPLHRGVRGVRELKVVLAHLMI